jgi:hypothetical protein
MVDETNNDDAIKIGHTYCVKRLDGEYCPAEVLETRTLKSNQIEYFVHFENSKLFSFILFSNNRYRYIEYKCLFS